MEKTGYMQVSFLQKEKLFKKIKFVLSKVLFSILTFNSLCMCHTCMAYKILWGLDRCPHVMKKSVKTKELFATAAKY